MDVRQKVRENKNRRAAKRQGLELEKCPRRDPRALGFGTFRIVNGRGTVIAGDKVRFGLTLEQVEAFLKGGEQ